MPRDQRSPSHPNGMVALNPGPRHYVLLCYAMLYDTILYYTILYYTILYYTILYYNILYYTILYTILYIMQVQRPFHHRGNSMYHDLVGGDNTGPLYVYLCV